MTYNQMVESLKEQEQNFVRFQWPPKDVLDDIIRFPDQMPHLKTIEVC